MANYNLSLVDGKLNYCDAAGNTYPIGNVILTMIAPRI